MDTDIQMMKLALTHAATAVSKGTNGVGAVFVRYGLILEDPPPGRVRALLPDHPDHHLCCYALWNTERPASLTGYTVYVTLEPCVHCLFKLMRRDVTRIVYGFKDTYDGSHCLLEQQGILPRRFTIGVPAIEGGILSDQSKLLLQHFFLERGAERAGRWSDPAIPLRQAVFRD